MLPAQGFRAGLAPVLAAVQAASDTGAILRLGAVAGAPLMPSLNGWLLGYPVVYLVDGGSVDAVAEALSHAPLLLVRVVAFGPWVRSCMVQSACAGWLYAISQRPGYVAMADACKEQGASRAVACRRDPADASKCMSTHAEESCHLVPALRLLWLCSKEDWRMHVGLQAIFQMAYVLNGCVAEQACETKPATLASFTVPAALVGAGEQGADAPWLVAWLAGMQAAACASALWAFSGQPLRLDVSVVSCRVAL